MTELTSRERLSRAIRCEAVDRVPTFDILHNIDLIEHLAEDRITPENAEDLLCRAAGKVLDLIRHFAVPDRREPWFLEDENGFVYRYEWWTAHVVKRPEMRSTRDIEDVVKRDMESIRRDTEAKKICRIARQHVRLYDENFEYMEEVKEHHRRISEKLDGTVMLPPEDVSPMGIVTERLDETGWWYLYTDSPELARSYMDALTDYQMCFIDEFADAAVCPFTQISVPVGGAVNLLYPPEYNRKEVLPREKKKIDRWKKHGYTVMAFLDGYKWPLIDDYLEAGAEEIHPFEPYCGMEVKRFREKYPDVAVGQPIDCTQLLPFGSQEDVRSAVVKAINDAGGRGIIIGSTSEIHPKVKPENALVMYETARSCSP